MNYTKQANKWLKEYSNPLFYENKKLYLPNMLSDFANHIVNTHVIEKIDIEISCYDAGIEDLEIRGEYVAAENLINQKFALEQLKKQLSDEKDNK